MAGMTMALFSRAHPLLPTLGPTSSAMGYVSFPYPGSPETAFAIIALYYCFGHCDIFLMTTSYIRVMHQHTYHSIVCRYYSHSV